MTDEVIPGFSKRKSEGEVFFNPMTHVSTTGVRVDGGYHHNRQMTGAGCSGTSYFESKNSRSNPDYWYGYLLQNGNMAFPYPKNILPSDRLSDLISEVSSGVLSARGRSTNDLTQTFAEMDQSLRLVPGLCTDLYNLIDKTSKRSNVKTAASVYLAYRYGARPLMQDINGVLEGVKKALGRTRTTTRRQAKWSTQETSKTTFVAAQGTFNFDIVSRAVMTVRGMSLDEYNATTALNIGFSIKNLLALPYELVPYSFVADNFANIGDVLGQYLPSPEFTQLGSSLVVRTEEETSLIARGCTPSATYTIPSQETGTYICTRSSTHRSSGLSAGSVVWRSDFHLDNIQKAADYLSLIAVKIRIPTLNVAVRDYNRVKRVLNSARRGFLTYTE
jgi:hypothetical protein